MHILKPAFKQYDENEKKKLSISDLEKCAQAEVRNNDPNRMVELPPPKEIPDSCLVLCDGYWWLRSTVDRRWRAEGKGEVGGTDMCEPAKKAFFEMKQKFGNPPWDFVYRFEPRSLSKFKLASDPDEILKRNR
jgi:hypothetical protein